MKIGRGSNCDRCRDRNLTAQTDGRIDPQFGLNAMRPLRHCEIAKLRICDSIARDTPARQPFFHFVLISTIPTNPRLLCRHSRWASVIILDLAAIASYHSDNTANREKGACAMRNPIQKLQDNLESLHAQRAEEVDKLAKI